VRSLAGALVSYSKWSVICRRTALVLAPERGRKMERRLRPSGRPLVVQKSGRGEAWIPDPMGSDAETFCAAMRLRGLQQLPEARLNEALAADAFACLVSAVCL